MIHVAGCAQFRPVQATAFRNPSEDAVPVAFLFRARQKLALVL